MKVTDWEKYFQKKDLGINCNWWQIILLYARHIYNQLSPLSPTVTVPISEHAVLAQSLINSRIWRAPSYFRAEFVSCLEFEPSIPIREYPHSNYIQNIVLKWTYRRFNYALSWTNQAIKDQIDRSYLSFIWGISSVFRLHCLLICNVRLPFVANL